jgi:AcrR family transcriptional regulator
MPRADAIRNRERILAAAARLFAEQGVRNVSMDAVAAAAGVGKGTLYRGFGDRAGLALSLLDERERELQDGFLRGPPPLGPGAPPRDRLRAFVRAQLALLESHLDLIVESENATTGARYRSGVYAAWEAHTAVLVEELAPDADAQVTAAALLAPLAGDLYRHLRIERAMPARRIERGLLALVDRLV